MSQVNVMTKTQRIVSVQNGWEAELGSNDVALVTSPCHPLGSFPAQSLHCEGRFQVSGDTTSIHSNLSHDTSP